VGSRTPEANDVKFGGISQPPEGVPVIDNFYHFLASSFSKVGESVSKTLFPIPIYSSIHNFLTSFKIFNFLKSSRSRSDTLKSYLRLPPRGDQQPE